jgi:hypothetical protein
MSRVERKRFPIGGIGCRTELTVKISLEMLIYVSRKCCRNTLKIGVRISRQMFNVTIVLIF